MRTLLILVAVFGALLLTGCPVPADNQPAPGGDASGMVVGKTLDGEEIKVGEGELKGKSVYLTYFASW